MKICFLDIDGVLNYIGCKSKLRKMYFVDDEKLKLLKQLIDKTGAKIVLSSTWRFGWRDIDEGKDSIDVKDFIALRDKCLEFGIEFLDYTPVYYYYRGEEIDFWLKDWKGEPIESFVILDDGVDMEPYLDHLVHT